MSADNVVFIFVGPSGSGKTTLMLSALKLLPEKISLVQSFTTREKRPGEDAHSYYFIDKEEFKRTLESGGIAQWVLYADNYYGSLNSTIKDILKKKHAIIAVTEHGVIMLKEAGYQVATIKVIPKGATLPEKVSQTRLKDDEARAKIKIDFDLEVVNSFELGGKEKATQEVVNFINKFPLTKKG